MSDELFTALLPRSGLRVVAALTTEVSREGRRLHRAEAGSAALLSEALTAVSLLAALQKERARVSLQLECDGPVRGVFVDAEVGVDELIVPDASFGTGQAKLDGLARFAT